MIPVNTIWQSAIQKINVEQNGDLDAAGFNLSSLEGELRFIDWLTGDVEGVEPPEPYRTQKNSDWLNPVRANKSANAENGIFSTPEDYYRWDNFYVLGMAYTTENCESDVVVQNAGCNTPIEILSAEKFNQRCNSWIAALRPSRQYPIAKPVAGGFEVMPNDLGSLKMEYIRYPKFAELKTVIDPVYNNRVVDEKNSTNYEWDYAALPLLVWFITNAYSDSTRENALKKFNQETGKTVRG